MVLRNGDLDAKWLNYGWTAVTFGDRPASCILEICKDLAADASQDIDPEAARAIREDTYIDNGATRGSKEAVRRMITDITKDKDGSLTYSGTISRIFKRLVSH